MYKISRTLDLISQSLEGGFGGWKFCHKGMRLSISYDYAYCADVVNRIGPTSSKKHATFVSNQFLDDIELNF